MLWELAADAGNCAPSCLLDPLAFFMPILDMDARFRKAGGVVALHHICIEEVLGLTAQLGDVLEEVVVDFPLGVSSSRAWLITPAPLVSRLPKSPWRCVLSAPPPTAG